MSKSVINVPSHNVVRALDVDGDLLVGWKLEGIGSFGDIVIGEVSDPAAVVERRRTAASASRNPAVPAGCREPAPAKEQHGREDKDDHYEDT